MFNKAEQAYIVELDSAEASLDRNLIRSAYIGGKINCCNLSAVYLYQRGMRIKIRFNTETVPEIA